MWFHGYYYIGEEFKLSFCSSCGKKVNLDSKFCIACGQTLEITPKTDQTISQTASGLDPEINATNPVAPLLTQSPSKRFSRKVVILTVVALLVVASSALAYEVFLKKTPKELFALSEINTVKNTFNELQKEYGADLEFQKALTTTPSKTNLELSGDFDLGKDMSSNDLRIKQMLKNSKVTMTSSSDPVQQISDNVVSLVLKGSNLLDAEFFQSKDQLGLKVPMINDKHFYVNPNEFGKAAKRIYPYYSGPEKLDLNQYSFKNLKFKQEDWTKIGLKYVKFFDSNLPEEYFTVQKGVPYNSPDGEKKFRQLTLNMNSEQTQLFLNKLVAELSNDTELRDILANNIVEFAKLSSTSGNSQYQRLADPSLAKEEIKNNFEQLKNNFKNLKFPDGLKMVIIINDNETIVNQQYKFTVVDADNPGGVSLNLETKSWDGKNDKKTSSLDLVLQPPSQKDSKFTLNTQSETTKETAGMKTQFTAIGVVYNQGSKSGDLSLNFNTLISPENGDKRQSNSDFVVLASGNFGQIPKLNGKISRTVDQNLSKKYSNQDLGIQLNVEIKSGYSINQNANVSVNLKNNTTLIDKVQLPSLNAGNSVNLGTVSDSEWSNISQQIQSSVEMFYVKNQALLSQFY